MLTVMQISIPPVIPPATMPLSALPEATAAAAAAPDPAVAVIHGRL
jgi:hypothetical protein